jgi:hypothetical protein
MPINEEATMDGDLTNLRPVELLCTIQGLLLNNSSDDVRALLITQGVTITDDATIPRDDTSFSFADLLESPFFIAKNLRELPRVQTNDERNQSSSLR